MCPAHRELLPALGTARRQNLAASPRGHPRAEAVHSRATPNLGLVCSLGHAAFLPKEQSWTVIIPAPGEVGQPDVFTRPLRYPREADRVLKVIAVSLDYRCASGSPPDQRKNQLLAVRAGINPRQLHEQIYALLGQWMALPCTQAAAGQGVSRTLFQPAKPKNGQSVPVTLSVDLRCATPPKASSPVPGECRRTQTSL